MSGKSAFGTSCQLSIASVYTTIARVSNIGGPKMKRDTKDVSAHDSTGQWMEKIATMKDGGEISLDINYDDDGSTDQAIFDLLDDGTLTPFKIIFPTNNYFGGDCYVTGFEAGAPHDDKLSASVTLTITGPVTFTTA